MEQLIYSDEEAIKCSVQIILGLRNLLKYTVVKLDSPCKVTMPWEMFNVTFSTLEEDYQIQEGTVTIKVLKNNNLVLTDSYDNLSNESFLYGTVFPIMANFQQAISKLKLSKTFMETLLPLYYGTYKTDNVEIMIFQDMQKDGYENLREAPWNSREIRKEIEMIVDAYGELHAISACLEERKPEAFQIIKNMYPEADRISNIQSMIKVFQSVVDETCEMLRHDISWSILFRWRRFKDQIPAILDSTIHSYSKSSMLIGFGTNDFLFKYKVDGLPAKLLITNWHLSTLANVTHDLSSFLYYSLNQFELSCLQRIAIRYYVSFSTNVWNLRGDPDKLFSYARFVQEWNQFNKCGLLTAILQIKLNDFDTDYSRKQRLKILVEHAVTSGIIDNDYEIRKPELWN